MASRYDIAKGVQPKNGPVLNRAESPEQLAALEWLKQQQHPEPADRDEPDIMRHVNEIGKLEESKKMLEKLKERML